MSAVSPRVRPLVSMLAFGVYVAIQSTLHLFGGPWRVLLAAISGAGLMVALRLFADEVRDKGRS